MKKLIPSSVKTNAVLMTALLALLTVVPFQDAFAEAKSLTAVQQNISLNVAYMPKLIAVLAYVIGAFFAATGLVKLKDWIADGEKNSINPALFRLVVAALLVVFPHMLVLFNTTLFGSQSQGATQNVKDTDNIKVQSLSAFN